MATKDSKFVKYLSKKVEIKGKPDVGDNIAVYVRPGDKIDFELLGFDLENANFKLIGGDIVLEIPNAGSYTFVSMALMAYNDLPPEFLSSGKTISLSTILSNVEEINALPVTSVATNEFINIPDATSDQEKKNKTTEENQDKAPQVIVIENEAVAENDNISQSLEESKFETPAENIDVVEVEYTSNATDNSSDSNTQESIIEGATPTLNFDIDIQHIEISSDTLISTAGNRTLIVEGGGGSAYGNIYPDTNSTIDRTEIIKQTDAEVIDYSNVSSIQASSLVINADNANYFDENTIGRTITLSPEQPEGYAIEKITLSSNGTINDFVVTYGTFENNTWVVNKDNPETEEIDGYTFDSTGNIQVSFSINRNQTNPNFEINVEAESVFSIDNVSEENQATIEVPVETTLTFQKSYGINVKEIENINNPDEYLFESFTNANGEVIDSGFVITTNINDNIIYGSETVQNTINGGVANDTVISGIANDTIFGNSGNDIIISGLGDDTVDGGIGNDTLDFSSIDDQDNIGVDANLTTGLVTGDGTDIISNIENLTGTQDNDILTGNSEVNILKGESGSDTLLGKAGNDTLEGGDSNDTLEGGLGEDLLKGDAGIDTVSYKNAVSSDSSGVIVTLEEDVNIPGLGSATGIDGTDILWDFENVIGSNYDDTIIGNQADNILTALDGNDYIIGNTGNDTIDGGDGIDTIDFSDASSSEEIDLSINRAKGGDGIDRLFNIENVIGSRLDDTIIGDNEDNILDGNEGNDIISGGQGNDTLLGGLDNDTLTGGIGNDIIDGGENGNSLGDGDYANYSDITTGGVSVNLLETAAQDTINAGIDTLTNIENLIGSSFDDTLQGDNENNSLLGGSGNDTLISNGSSVLGSDYIDGGSGSDDLASFKSETQNIIIDLDDEEVQNTGVGNVQIKNVENLEGGLANDILYGSSLKDNELYGLDGNDILSGRSGNDSLFGGSGSDTLIGGEGNDLLDGENGIDTVDYSDSSAIKLILANSGLTAISTIGIEEDTVKDIENVIGSNFSDTIGGNSDNNILDGNLGDDLLLASDGNDTLIGNSGNDTIDYSARNNSINLILDENASSLLKENGVDKDTIFQIENVIGSQANDTITGDNNSNVIKGQEGDDTLSGSKGNDYIDGGEGNELIGDTVEYSYINDILTDSLGVNVNLALNKGIDLNSNNTDYIENIENVIGTKYDDTISGDEQDNILDSGLGNDTLKGGAGNDFFFGGEGIDTVDYSDVSEKLNIDLKSLTPTEVAVGQGIDSFDSIEGVIGGSNDDTLIGTNGANNILGNAGDDTLIGFGGDDTLDGGAGTDLVSFGFTTNDITLDLSNNSTQISGSGTLVVTNIENIDGGFGDDVLSGNDEKNVLKGEFGNDTLIGRGGNDTLDGGKNSDSHILKITNTGLNVTLIIGTITLTAASASEDVMLDSLIANFNLNNSDGTLGTIIKNGTEIYLQTSQTVSGLVNIQDTASTFIDVVDYSSLTTDFIDIDMTKTSEQINLSDGSKDTIIDIEKIIASKQDDNIVGDSNANIFEGNDGNDTINGGAGSDTIDGGAGDDIINGGADSDILNGGLGNDTFISSINDGIDIIDGGSGSDTIDYSVEVENINVTLNGAIQSTVSINSVANDLIENIENITTGSGDDTLIGDDKNNTFVSNDGDDILSGGAGNDYLDGGNNTSVGDSVDYTYINSVASYDKGINVNLDIETASDINGGTLVGLDTLKNIENVVGSKNDDSIVGNSSNNTLLGGLGDDILEGNGGDDSLDAGLGDDILKGGTGNDILNGGDGIDTADFSDANASVNIDLSSSGPVNIGAGLGTDTFILIEGAIGGNYDDIITGTSGANTLIGNGGNDTLLGGGSTNGYDYIDGGSGVDFVSFNYLTNPNDNVTINLGLTYNATDNSHLYNDIDNDVDTYQDAGAAGNIFIQNIENIETGAGNDTLIGNSSINTLLAGSGDDWLIGKSNSNELDGQSGIDTADYSFVTSGVGLSANMNAGTDGIDSLGEVTYEASFVDTLKNIENIRATKNDDEIIGDSNDNIANIYEGMAGSDTIDGGSGDDIIYGNNITNTDSVNDEADTLSGGSGDDTIYGQSGDDTLIGNLGADTLNGGIGSDTVDFSYLNSQSNGVIVDFNTSTANDTNDIDTLVSIENAVGSSNSDTFIMQEGNSSNIIDGKTAIDTIDYSNYSASNAINVNLSISSSQTISIGDSDTILNIENLTAGLADDTITGSSLDNVLDGNEGSDTFFSSDGADTINGGLDATLNDIDIVDYSTQNSKIVLSTITGTNDYLVNKTASAKTDSLTNIEQIQGTDFDDTLIGDNQTDVFKGGNSDDILNGADGIDSLYGEEGNDTLIGGSGNDILDGGNNTAVGDYVDYSLRSTGVKIDLSNSQVMVDIDNNSIFDASDELDSLLNIENAIGSQDNDNIIGSSIANTLFGNSGNDTIDGGAQNDYLSGEDGDDTLIGGAGADNLFGNSGDDTFKFTAIVDESKNDFIDGGETLEINGDTVDYSSLTSQIQLNLDDASAVYVSVGSSNENHQIKDIENIIGTNLTDNISGNSDKSKVISFVVKPKLTKSVPAPPSKVSSPPKPIKVSSPALPRILFAPLVPIKVSSLLPPITPSIESKESIPCPTATSVGVNDFKSIFNFSLTSL